MAEIAAATERPERVVGMHFFNPAPVLAARRGRAGGGLLGRGGRDRLAFAERIGKRPIRCRDTPGFVVNRILIPLLNDCVRVLDEAGVTPEDLDTAMTAGVNWPIGPCALIDLIGVDVHVHASEALYDALGEERMRPPPAARRDAGERQARAQDRRGLLPLRARRPARGPRIKAR